MPTDILLGKQTTNTNLYTLTHIHIYIVLYIYIYTHTHTILLYIDLWRESQRLDMEDEEMQEIEYK